MKHYIICDLDGTLCDTAHREQLAHGPDKNWPAFFAGIPNDTLNPAVDYLLCHLDKTCVIFVTGRPSEYENETRDWLEKHGYKNIILFMRRAGDFREDSVVKREIYQEQIEPEYGKPIFVLDDRQQVVDMWRTLGLSCFQVAPGEF